MLFVETDVTIDSVELSLSDFDTEGNAIQFMPGYNISATASILVRNDDSNV